MHVKKEIYEGFGLAILAAIIWSFNFILARYIFNDMPPVSIAFYRWLTGTLFLMPFALKFIIFEWPVIKKNIGYLALCALTGISLFNTIIYIAAHFTSAINMALIGTTTSPVFVIILSAIFLKEKIAGVRIAGLVLCLAGIVLLLSEGNLATLLQLQFSKGDVWVLLGALSFSVYSLLVKRKPAELSGISFLGILFCLGTLIIFPFFLLEQSKAPPILWNTKLITIILYLGIGASAIAFLSWNAAIAKLGTVRTSLFGNLIPIFASVEAVWLLHEELSTVHLYSGVLVITGLILANSRKANAAATAKQTTA